MTAGAIAAGHHGTAQKVPLYKILYVQVLAAILIGGILGAKYLLNALTENGRADVAYRIASQKDLPSWGWWLEQGATTLWEQWNGTESHNHIMFGDISAWFYKALAGIPGACS